MKKYISILYGCLISILLTGAMPTYGMSTEDSLFNERCRQLDFPILYIETQDSVLPTYEIVQSPPGCDGLGITNNEKVPGKMIVVLHGDTLYDTGAYKKDTSGLTIKVRGNTSASLTHTDKKPYKIKLQKKKDLLFRGNDKVYADKEWVLLRTSICETLVGNMANRGMGMEWTPAQQPVFVFMNDRYWGIYLLTECIKRNQKCRVDINEEGFLFEYDAYWWNEDCYFDSRYTYNYTLKYPECDEILPDQEAYLVDLLQKAESAYLNPQSLDSVIDIPSYVRWLWVQDMLGSKDAGGANMYFAKKDTKDGSKLSMICAWDFDGCYRIQNGNWSTIHAHWWFADFFAVPQVPFVSEFVRLYDDVVENLYDTLINTIDSLCTSPFVATLDSAYVMDNQRWGEHNKSAKQQLYTIKIYLQTRKGGIAQRIEELRASYERPMAVPTAIMISDSETRAFDMLGRPVPENTSGLFMIIRDTDGRVTKRITLP